MAYNDNIIRALHRCFIPVSDKNGKMDVNNPFTNCALIFAYNGTGKTRLSYDFAHYGRNEESPSHTLYYNAYTEDLFTWDNDLDSNTEHHLLINTNSALIQGLAGYNFSDKLRKYLHIFTNIDFDFHYDENNPEIPDYVTFSKTITFTERLNGEKQTFEDTIENIKISRGEERIFVWCFFRCIIDQVINGNDAYKNIEYIYIDDPMSSLDDNNVIAFAEQLYAVIRKQREQEVKDFKDEKNDLRRIKFIVSSHHALFFHTMLHGLSGDKQLGRYYLSCNRQRDNLVLKSMSNETPFYYNVAMMSEIKKAIDNDKLYVYHFTILRSIMERIKEFFGHHDLTIILKGITYKDQRFDETAFTEEELTDFYARVVNVLTHQVAMFAPKLMVEDNKDLAIAIFNHLMDKYQFCLPNLDDYHCEKKSK
ncbi:MAG: hypothetical protein MJ010_01670 [Paludibacteraceae bacterium]|nr:hypothetical protein [Paludibacteraceae bacterium]